ncbi:MAG: AraC family transcriptional regulator [Bacteroidales bacterium]|nr:AraC family transcriptional regulator [Bacteroidales bacterium]
MNSAQLYPLLLCLSSGITMCLLVAGSIFLLRHHRSHQFQRAFAFTMLMLSFGFFNNFIVLTISDENTAAFVNMLLILYDYIVVGGYMIFVVTLVFPERFSTWRLALFEIPYIFAIALYAITRNPMVYPAVQIYTLVASSVLLVWLVYSIKKYNRMLLDNVGDIEHLNLNWAVVLIVLMYVVQLFWAAESLSNESWFSVPTADSNLLFDTLWCFITIAYVLFILRKIICQQVFTDEPAPSPAITPQENPSSSEDYYKVLNNIDLDCLINEKKFYQDTTLTLQKLATHLGTNRQYLSNFINREKQKTFYEYINDFRLEEAKRLLDGLTNEAGHSMEDIATMSGFNSYATFLRQFVKKYGEYPSQYIKETSKQTPSR